MRILFFLLIGILCTVYSPASASEPFGLKIGDMKFSDFQKEVRSTDNGINSWSNGIMRNIPASELKIEGLTKALAIFNEDNTLVGLLLTFNKNRFDSLNSMAKKNYQMVSSQTPYVGNKQVIYKDGNTEISLNSPHMSFEMSMHFLDKSLIEAYKSGRKRKHQEKQAKESSALFGGN